MNYYKILIVCVLKLRNNCNIMTVAELIEQLKELPQDYTVTASRHNDCGYSYEVTHIYEYDEIIHEVELS
jgi:hypothetical protein